MKNEIKASKIKKRFSSQFCIYCKKNISLNPDYNSRKLTSFCQFKFDMLCINGII